MGFIDLFFPKKCLECGISGRYICKKCLKKVQLGGLYGSNYSIFKYEKVIRKAIIALKYKYATSVSDELAEICVDKLSTVRFLLKPILIPIPLHKYRKNFRGFNQSEIIGEKIAKEMDWKFIPDLLIRTKQTTPQVELKGVDRRKNLSDVFAVNYKYRSRFTGHSSFVVFDDVYTTGSTINEAKKILFEAGLRNIKSLTIAR